MLFVEYSNGCNLYRYNDGTAVAIEVIGEEVRFFSNYAQAFAWTLPF